MHSGRKIGYVAEPKMRLILKPLDKMENFFLHAPLHVSLSDKICVPGSIQMRSLRHCRELPLLPAAKPTGHKTVRVVVVAVFVVGGLL